MKVLKYILAIPLIIAALSGFINREFLPSIIFLTLGMTLIPPISEYLKKKIGFWKQRIVRYPVYAGLVLIAGASVSGGRLNTEPKSESSKQYPKSTSIQNSAANDSFNPKNSNAEKTVKETVVEKQEIKMDNSDFWKEFDPIVKVRIHKLIANQDCVGLQNEFNTTANNMDRIQNAGGSGKRNLNLMDFINKEMRKLNCY